MKILIINEGKDEGNVKVMGIDIGAVTIKVVIMENNNISYHSIITIADEKEIAARKAMEKSLKDTGLEVNQIHYTLSTGTSRKKIVIADEERSPIICLAKGARWLYPNARTVIDVGAENTVVLNLNEVGKLELFIYNDKCAAGSGVFLESLAKMLKMSVEDMAKEALKAEKAAIISGVCAIFAEQEIISYAYDVPPVPMTEIIAGLYEALAARVIGLARRTRIVPEVVLCGGVAKNQAFVKSLNKRVNSGLLVPEEPQIVTALGAAILAKESAQAKKGD